MRLAKNFLTLKSIEIKKLIFTNWRSYSSSKRSKHNLLKQLQYKKSSVLLRQCWQKWVEVSSSASNTVLKKPVQTYNKQVQQNELVLDCEIKLASTKLARHFTAWLQWFQRQKGIKSHLESLQHKKDIEVKHVVMDAWIFFAKQEKKKKALMNSIEEHMIRRKLRRIVRAWSFWTSKQTQYHSLVTQYRLQVSYRLFIDVI